MAKTISKIDSAWLEILKKYPQIEKYTKNGGIYEIKADDIRKFREPRLMTKFDTSESVAEPLKERGLNILPLSRSSYAIGRFDLYEKFSTELTDTKPVSISLPDYETLRVENITSESNAINALLASHTLERFLGEEGQNLTQTFNGRMGTGNFGFNVNLKGLGNVAKSQYLRINGAQLEIDGGFESQNSICIMEAKNIQHDNFNVRQLYFPYRKYLSIVKKPIRLVFSQYVNMTYYLHEYKFTDPNSFSSIELVDTQAYTFKDNKITMKDLISTWQDTEPTISDDHRTTQIPFIQADKFKRIIALAERLNTADNNIMTTDEVTEFMGTVQRQANYYSSAGIYLGLFERLVPGKIHLTEVAHKILKLDYKERQLAYVGLILRHKIFHNLFKVVINKGTVPDKPYIEDLMIKLNVCEPFSSTVTRRASSVVSWLEWILSLNDDR